MRMHPIFLTALLIASPASGQGTNNPFERPIAATDGVITVNFVEFATIPRHQRRSAAHDDDGRRAGNAAGCSSARCAGRSISVSYDGKTVTPYVDVNAPEVGRTGSVPGHRTRRPELRLSSAVQPARRARLRQVLHLHRHEQHDAEGRLPAERRSATRTISCCWSGRRRILQAATYDGGAPRELFRVAHPFPNHNGGMIGFNPLTPAGRSRLRPALRRLGRRRQRRRPVQPRAEPGVRVRQDSPHRPARDATAPTASTASRRRIRS